MKKQIAILLILCNIVFIFAPAFSACEANQCIHDYDNTCDITCNECNKERTITHDFENATCAAPKTCSICGVTEGKALKHTSNTDNDCTTTDTCASCGATMTTSQTHIFGDLWQKDAHEHWHACENHGCAVTDSKVPHTPNIPEATREQAQICTICNYIINPIKQDIMVWIPTKGGTKYHSKASCSNMINPIQISIEEAALQGFTACQRCH